MPAAPSLLVAAGDGWAALPSTQSLTAGRPVAQPSQPMPQLMVELCVISFLLLMLAGAALSGGKFQRYLPISAFTTEWWARMDPTFLPMCGASQSIETGPVAVHAAHSHALT